MDKQRLITLALIVAMTAFAIHILYNNTRGARLDFTETKLYSLTDGTHQILDKLQKEGVKPITIKLYFSNTAGKQLPKFIKNFITYQDYVQNLLHEYERESGGKLRVEVIDPVPDSDEAEDATDYGLDGKPINQHGDKFFFGMVFETQTGSKDVIDFLWPEKQESIEYEISKHIHGLVWPDKKKIGVLSGLDPLPDDNPYMAQLMAAQGKQPQEPWISMRLLQESYEVARIDKEADAISHDDYDLLLVIHPRNFTDKQLFALDSWIVTGGRTIVFLDPYSIEDRPPQNPQQPWAALQYKPSSNLDKLMEKWGINRPEDLFVADFELGLKRPVDRSGQIYKVITDLMITDATAAKTLDQENPIFQGLANIRFFMAGALEKKGESNLEITPLIHTTNQGGTLRIEPGFGEAGKLAYTDLQNPNKLQDAYAPEDREIALAFLLRGQFNTAFPEGATFPASTPEPPPGMPPGFQMPPDENAEMIQKEAVPADTYKESAVIVFSDVDFITDQLAFQESFFGVTAVNDNHKALLNAIDYMVGAEELMKVRSKEQIRRPFVLFDRIEAEADSRLLDKEQNIRADIERFQKDLQEKQRGLSQGNATLFKKKVQDEIDQLNAKIRDDNKRLREIRMQKRAALESEETFVRVSILAFMPGLVCLGGLFTIFRRRKQRSDAKQEGATHE